MSSRREFLKAAGLGTAALAAVGATGLGCTSMIAAPKNPVPRWRGFHYHYFSDWATRATAPTTQATRPPRRPMTAASLEEDFRFTRDWGFDFVRIGVQYWDWVDYTDKSPNGGPLAKDLLKIKESGLTRIDEVIEMARKYGLHVHLDMHRGPGYNFREAMDKRENEPFSLWTDKVAQDAFLFYWDMFAKRYRGISSKDLSFDLLNEPVGMAAQWASKFGLPSRAIYQKVMTMAIEKIRETSPERIILVEGLDKVGAADDIVPEMIPWGVAQSIHGYAPTEISHYKRHDNIEYPAPTWPVKLLNGSTFGRDEYEKLYAPWAWLITQGIGVHCGEFGFSSPALPHKVGLMYLADVLDVLKRHQIGWTYLSFSGGPWGVLDGNRTDIVYEDYHGHKLDRQLLTLLQYH